MLVVIEDGLPILELHAAQQEQFVTTRTSRSPAPPERDRGSHAAGLLRQLDQVEGQLADLRRGLRGEAENLLVAASGPHLDDPQVAKSLAPRGSGLELVARGEGRAIVRVREDLSSLRTKANAYATENTSRGNPRYNNLIARIENVELATIEDLSYGEIDANIPDDELFWVEIWTRGGQASDAHAATDASVREFARLTPDPPEDIPVFRGLERDVHLIRSTGASLKSLPLLLPLAAEVHLAPEVLPIILAEAADEAGEVADVAPPRADAAVVAVHDSGVDGAHPYIAPILVGHASVVPGEPATLDIDGHGTQVAGVAAYSSLASDVAAGTVRPDAWLVSVRLLESETEAGGDPERGAMWASRTVEAVETAETLAPDLSVIHNLSLGADNPAAGQALDRTSWSVAADSLAWNTGKGRLMVVAAGNCEPITNRDDYPFLNLGPPYLQQPGQAWNVLTVGGYTDLDQLTPHDERMGYPTPLARAGELSPHSRSSAVANKPIKPDIVMEAGNTAPGAGLENPEAQGLSILTLRSAAQTPGALLRRTYKTSPAAAAASNALARIASEYPALRPATWRALLVNTARWPETALNQMQDPRDLLRTFGYGVPEPGCATTSSSNRPVMFYEGQLRPCRRGPDGRPDRPIDFIELPLPDDELHAVGDSLATVSITLSYFIQPTDNPTRRAYAGARLRWDLQGPAETEDSFRARVNRLVQDQGVTPGAGSYRWAIPADTRSRGTLQHDHALVSAASVAGRRLLAVYPVLGWWEDSRLGHEMDLPYSVVVSVDLGEVDVDLYALIASVLAPGPTIEITT
jgi:hypothetical protein